MQMRRLKIRFGDDDDELTEGVQEKTYEITDVSHNVDGQLIKKIEQQIKRISDFKSDDDHDE